MTLDLHRTDSQHRFAAMLDKLPWLAGFWNWDRPGAECDLDRIRECIGVWSHGERVMAQFLVGVWSGQNVLDFDLLDAASILDAKHRAIIQDWLDDPFWP